MTTIHRRHFLELGGLAALAGAVRPTLAHGGAPVRPDNTPQKIRFDHDGLGLTPGEYAALLSTAAGKTGILPDYYSLGGAVEVLERKFAALLGKESAAFMPTGTLANHIALRKLAGDRRRVLVQAESHIYNDSGDCAQSLSGLNLIPLAPGRATFTLDEVREWVQRSATGRVETKIGVIAIETPVRRKHHEMFDFEEMRKISAYSREQKINLHLDGARLFNVPYHSGRSIREYTSLFDTVYVSLWKCFNAASGAVLAGSHEFTEGLFHLRRMFGGGLPGAWPFAAVALHYADDYGREYSSAWAVADAFLSIVRKDPRFVIEKVANGTSAVVMSVKGVTAATFAARLLEHNIMLPQPQKGASSFWMTVNTTLNRIEAGELAERFVQASRP